MIKVILLCYIIANVEGNQCTDAESLAWIDQPVFTNTLIDCAVQGMGVRAPVQKCLVSKLPLSTQCLNCFSESVDCGRVNCAQECVKDSGSYWCLTCISNAGCKSAQSACTGFSRNPNDPISLSNTYSTKNTGLNIFSIILFLLWNL